LVEKTYPGLNCAKTAWLKPPADVHSRYSANLYLDCSRLRSGTAGTVSAVK